MLCSADLQGGWGLCRGQGPTRPLPPAASPPSTATGTLSIEILEVNDHAPELSPPWGSLCSTPDRGYGLLLGATDEDLPPHGAPFHFQLSPRVPELARNWSLSQVNGEPPLHTPLGFRAWGRFPLVPHQCTLRPGRDWLSDAEDGWGNRGLACQEIHPVGCFSVHRH